MTAAKMSGDLASGQGLLLTWFLITALYYSNSVLLTVRIKPIRDIAKQGHKC